MPSTPLNNPQQKQQKRKGRILALLLFLMVVGCAIAFPVLFVLNKEEESVVAEEGVDVIVTLEPTTAVMTTAQTQSYESAVLKFYALNLAAVRLKDVSMTSQLLVDVRNESGRRQLQQQQQDRALRTTVRIVPTQANVTSLQLANLMDTKGDELLSLLQKETTDNYFDALTVVYATAVTTASTPTTAPLSQDTTCNGLSNLCDISVSDILFATMHNAHADRSVSPLFPNQNQNWQAGLEAGIRGLNMDLGFCSTQNGTVLAFMHTTCVIGFSEAYSLLKELHQWLTDHPNEVILMPLQIENSGAQPVRIVEDVAPLFERIVDTNGKSMAERLYAYEGETWPTLREMIDVDQRILLFFYNTDETCESIQCPRGFHDWFAYAAETEFVFDSVDAIQQDAARACGITRGGSGTRDFYGVNVFLEIPNPDASAILHQADFLSSHLEECSQQSGLSPNLVIVDFWDEGDLMQVVNDRNAQLRPSSAAGVNSTSNVDASPVAAPSLSPSVLLLTDAPVPPPRVESLSPSIAVRDEVAAPTRVPVASPIAASPPINNSTRTCNGLSNLCDMSVNATLFATMHNAHADRESKFFIPNHDLNLLAGLQAGIRGLSIDIGLCQVDGVLKLSLVHGVCFVGTSDPFVVFAGINNFLQQNPNEVIIIPTQIADDLGGTVQLTEIYSIMEQVVNDAGISMADRLYAHPGPTTPWPTLGELIDLDKRILFFIYNGQQTCESGCPVGFHDWFAYAMETRFEFDDAAAILSNPEDACVVTRGGTSSTRSFFGVNVFTRVANSEASTELNDAAFLRQHIETCSTVNGGKDPNLLLVDFWNVGGVIQVAQEYNAQLGAA
ncbi:hypothetical protein FisN_10Lh344 [Fistulifera solaris]|uniref:Phosphatidylinositol-specific phospholipase C X domain-containing protein n=1 Tax=Fistulifera solaris TaxID=1519565 RepID=A0A1Z5KFW1_FISSO|nr:hypothetical protein FisN_10Lh344 [Fistulifera solaris]|eukprot:GAX25139.1 hypothetical protein FisN_10Lh344 [Fistulifera solaris]